MIKDVFKISIEQKNDNIKTNNVPNTIAFEQNIY